MCIMSSQAHYGDVHVALGSERRLIRSGSQLLRSRDDIFEAERKCARC